MESGQIALQELVAQLEENASVTFRMALKKRQDTWRLHTLVIDVFPHAPGEEADTFTYEYDGAALLAGSIPGRVAAAWLTHAESQVQGQGDHVKDYAVQVPTLQEPVPWYRYPRHSQGDMVTVSWPYTLYQPYWSDRDSAGNQPEFLVSDVFPFFPDFQMWPCDFFVGTFSGRATRLGQERAAKSLRQVMGQKWSSNVRNMSARNASPDERKKTRQVMSQSHMCAVSGCTWFEVLPRQVLLALWRQ